MPISSAGIGSGLDIPSIVSQLMAIESQPLINLQNKQIEYEAQISAFGQLRSSMASFQKEMENLGTISTLDLYKTTSADDGVITASAESGADVGNYGIEVVRTADYHKMDSNEAADTDTFGGIAGDSVSVQLGSDPADTVSIDLTTAKTLAEIRDVINDDAGNPGVTATIIGGNGGNQKLILTSDSTGEASAMSVSYGGAVDLGLTTLNDIGGDLSLLDSEINVDGYNITRSTNTIDDVITGVTLNLQSADPGNTHSVNVERDNSAVSSRIQAFADAYDSLRAEIQIQRSGQLDSDSVLLSLERQLQNVLNEAATSSAFSYLTEVGVTMDRDGTMTVDTTRLDAALQDNFDDVAQLFAAEDDGFASRFYNLADGWLASDGIIETRTDGLNDRIDGLIDDQISERRNLEVIEARYQAEFTTLDVLIGQLTATSDYLTSQLAALPKIVIGQN
jgi:flagellar hook-associated protein 2